MNITESAFVPLQNRDCLICKDDLYDSADGHVKAMRSPSDETEVEVVDIVHPKPGVITLSCGHTYCVSCVSNWEKQYGSFKECSLHCKMPVIRELFPKKSVPELIEEAGAAGREAPLKSVLRFAGGVAHCYVMAWLAETSLSYLKDAAGALVSCDLSSLSYNGLLFLGTAKTLLLCKEMVDIARADAVNRSSQSFFPVTCAISLLANSIALFHVVPFYPLHKPLKAVLSTSLQVFVVPQALMIGVGLINRLAARFSASSLPENSRWRALGGVANCLHVLFREQRLIEAARAHWHV